MRFFFFPFSSPFASYFLFPLGSFIFWRPLFFRSLWNSGRFSQSAEFVGCSKQHDIRLSLDDSEPFSRGVSRRLRVSREQAAVQCLTLLPSVWRCCAVLCCAGVGIVVTVKQRQEFRIRLQKRARRAAERKLDNYVEEQNAKTVSTPSTIYKLLSLSHSPGNF